MKGNNKPKSFSKRVVKVISCQLFQEICIKKWKYCLLASIYSGKWHDLTWPRKGPKFNLHHLREISAVFKMAVLTPKSGMINMFKKHLQNELSSVNPYTIPAAKDYTLTVLYPQTKEQRFLFQSLNIVFSKGHLESKNLFGIYRYA